MSILVDRHHAGLLYSLQLLFEDRLEMELYVPVCHDWWDEGYWQFGKVFGDDRLAQQYLITEGTGWEQLSDWVYVTYDPEFPNRKICGITLEGFRQRTDWSYVMATVQENQPGFHRLAQESGAQYLLQVGNRGQQVAWDLDPIALVSAEAQIKGRGIVYHQEYDKDTTFRFRRPLEAAPGRIASFVNCFNSMPSQWNYFQEFEKELNAFDRYDCRVHGHDGREGLVHPTTALADAMARSQFGYHDKPQGDGFGHVIHYWASIGRPLIGHASYYQGLMPEPLWEDGVTAVLLDGRTPREAAAEVHELATDPVRYAEMCYAIRRRLDEVVDFDLEEVRIREVLGR